MLKLLRVEENLNLYKNTAFVYTKPNGDYQENIAFMYIHNMCVCVYIYTLLILYSKIFVVKDNNK